MRQPGPPRPAHDPHYWLLGDDALVRLERGRRDEGRRCQTRDDAGISREPLEPQRPGRLFLGGRPGPSPGRSGACELCGTGVDCAEPLQIGPMTRTLPRSGRRCGRPGKLCVAGRSCASTPSEASRSPTGHTERAAEAARSYRVSQGLPHVVGPRLTRSGPGWFDHNRSPSRPSRALSGSQAPPGPTAASDPGA